MDTQWTDTDNAHALGAAACTHQQEVQALQGQVRRLKGALQRARGLIGSSNLLQWKPWADLSKAIDAALADAPEPR